MAIIRCTKVKGLWSKGGTAMEDHLCIDVFQAWMSFKKTLESNPTAVLIKVALVSDFASFAFSFMLKMANRSLWVK